MPSEGLPRGFSASQRLRPGRSPLSTMNDLYPDLPGSDDDVWQQERPQQVEEDENIDALLDPERQHYEINHIYSELGRIENNMTTSMDKVTAALRAFETAQKASNEAIQAIQASRASSPTSSPRTVNKTSKPQAKQQRYVPPPLRNNALGQKQQDDYEEPRHERAGKQVQEARNRQFGQKHDNFDDVHGHGHGQGKTRDLSRDSAIHIPDEEPNPPDPPKSVTKPVDFKVHEIGFFHPGLAVSKELPQGPFVTSGKDVYYRDVYMFVQQLRRVARSKSVEGHLHLCLRGTAITWFSAMKSSIQDAMNDDLTLFCDRLISKYKLSHSRAFDLLHAEHYSMNDAKNLRPADDYIQTMLLHGQQCDQSAAAVLTLAWKNLDRDLQRDVRRPHGDPDEFARDLDDVAEYWASISSTKNKPTTYSPGYEYAPTRQHEEKEAAFQRGVRSTERRLLGAPPPAPTPPAQQQQQPFRNNNNNNFPRYPQPARLMPAPQQRQITANQANVEEFHEDDDYADQQQEHGNNVEYANFGAAERAYNRYEHVYFNDAPTSKHGMAPHSCTVCYAAFSNADKIDDHMLNDHGVDIQCQTSKQQKIYANWMEHAALHVVTIKPPPPERGYATIQGRMFDENGPQQALCIDTGSACSFIDETLLPKQQNLYGLLHKTQPITVRGIAGERIVDQIFDLKIHLFGTSGGHLCVNVNAYVTKGIQAGVILGMDELGRPEDDITLWLGRKTMQIQDISIPIAFTPRGSKPVAF